MRTTLTLDPDVAGLLEEEVHRQRKPFKQVVNDAIRRALSPGPAPATKPYRVKPVDARLAPGVDWLNLKQLANDLEDEAAIAKLKRTSRK